MARKMEELKNTLTIEEKKALVNQTNELLVYQNHVDTVEELKTLPSLKLEDIPSTINYLDSFNNKILSEYIGKDGVTYLMRVNDNINYAKEIVYRSKSGLVLFESSITYWR